MPEDFNRYMSEGRRLWVLKFLLKAEGYTLNDLILRELLRGRGHVVSGDALRTDLHWLQEQGLVNIEDLEEVWVATLRRRGQDVAEGLVTVPGVRRPAAEL